ncbi:ATP-dependent RNA helicase has1 [Aduncisulcus paluster]|uniref:ATP-dependent RNA helicase n=1 Tax=Aduncisulcus paluster TaxID=2918883 RepID=A0ABQ5KSQ3_9EUKA|nr:ATP-dependent RNA helicase has1 [Aduncisulcus paluster]
MTDLQPIKELSIHKKVIDILQKNKFTHLLPVQQKAIPELLKGKDAVISAKTGSGKTLTFLIPAIELLISSKMKPRNGTAVLIIAPVRELAQQIYDVAKLLFEEISQTVGVVIGGVGRNKEEERLSAGLNLLIATPGRLLDHLQTSEGFVYKYLSMLVIDEADRCLDAGFEKTMALILKKLPSAYRQTILTSATITPKVNALADLCFHSEGRKKDPLYIGIDDEADYATAEGLEQGYVECPSGERFLMLFSFLKLLKKKNKKTIVFMSSVNAVKFFHDLLNYISLEVLALHGKMSQPARNAVFKRFRKSEGDILLATDVAARGLDIPAVDWIVQFDPPSDVSDYIHRVGRTCRGIDGKKGRALLFLLPSEDGFLKLMKKRKIPTVEYDMPRNALSAVQKRLESLLCEHQSLNKSAREAFKSYLLSYASHTHKSVFAVADLDLEGVARGFGLSIVPRVSLPGITLQKTKKDKKKGRSYASSAAISEGEKKENPFDLGGKRRSSETPTASTSSAPIKKGRKRRSKGKK